MKRNLYGAFLFVAVIGLTGCGQPGQSERSAEIEGLQLNSLDQTSIIGGQTVTSSDLISATVVSVLDISSGSICTGSILTSNIIVTAAHCVESKASRLRVVFGKNIDDANVQVRTVQEYLVSPHWATRQWEEFNTGDIALIKIIGTIPTGFKAASLLTKASMLKDGADVVLAGYGITNGVAQTGSGELRKVATVIEDAAFTQTEVLIDQTQGRGACHGDSGGPAYLVSKGQLLLFGVTSRGVNDPRNDCSRYSAYTNILAYSQWVSKTAKYLASKNPPAAPAPSPVVGRRI